MSEPIIVANKLCKSFQGRQAVRDLTFAVHKGEIFGFLGPNGAGKSTTIRLLLGLLAPDSGTARVAGFDCWHQSKHIHHLCGVAFEISNLYERLTARENLSFFARLAGKGAREVNWALKTAGLSERAEEGVHQFSRGMRQRLILARAMLHRPSLLFLDEPTAGLDPNAAAYIRSLISRLQATGTTVFLTTHDMTEAEELCQRVGILFQGRLAGLGTVAELKDRFGEPSIQIAFPDANPSKKWVFKQSDPQWLRLVAQWQRQGISMHIHTQEATLAQVFQRLTTHHPAQAPATESSGKRCSLGEGESDAVT